MVQILDLTHENLWHIASFCMKDPEKEEWYSKGDEERIREAWRRKHSFLQKKLAQGARAKIAYKNGKPVGFIEYYPIEITNLEIAGKDIMAIWCINVAENERRKGIGGELLQACLDDSEKLGRKGVAVTCWDPIWMPSRFFKKHGFIEVGKAVGNGVVLFKRFENVENPKWIGRGSIYEEAKLVKEKAIIDIFHSDRCPIHWRNTALIKKVAAEFKDKVKMNEHNVDEREDMLKHRIEYSVYLDGKAIAAGPQVKESKVREKIRKKVKAKDIHVEQG